LEAIALEGVLTDLLGPPVRQTVTTRSAAIAGSPARTTHDDASAPIVTTIAILIVSPRLRSIHRRKREAKTGTEGKNILEKVLAAYNSVSHG
jgi:hypothetical protein